MYLLEETSQFQDLLFMSWPPGRIRIWSTRRRVFTFSGPCHMEKENFGMCSSRNLFSRNVRLEQVG